MNIEKLFELSDCVNEVQVALSKARSVITHVSATYSFNVEPTRILSGINNEGMRWLWEYRSIINYIQIVEDYTTQAINYIDKVSAAMNNND